MRLVILGAIMAAVLGACATAPVVPVAPVEQGAKVSRSNEYMLKSKGNGQDYVVLVSAPIEPLPAGEKAPVIYVMDGNWYFGMATDVVRMLAIGQEMGPAYIVAIAYSDPTFTKVVERRETDLVHKAFNGPAGMMGGGGEAFLSFLTDEVRPFVEARFPVDSGRSVLAGQSLGGLFATNVLLSKPDSFYGYLIGSPSLWADASLLEQSKHFAAGGGHAVYVGVGGGESPMMRNMTKKLAEALLASSTGLRADYAELARHSHSSMHGAWFTAGLAYLLPKAE
ncbi:MAG TPA: alpha/beta hydrolase-fold protein [Hyphomonadaceae bacterium]|mgnify:CR=1 FL=1|nr:alpha/beta hydrolase-fold protein [Hyphomonadaceae bacterium]HPN05128.1 alpha/beta hydrolase-fold protein [Hyphomonadaceae bacterium]